MKTLNISIPEGKTAEWINGVLTLVDENTADKRILVDQTVKTNVPERFNLQMPIFKGSDRMTFEVEIYFNPSDITCSLVSPEANDEVERVKNGIIDNVLNRIKAAYEDIVIIEK